MKIQNTSQKKVKISKSINSANFNEIMKKTVNFKVSEFVKTCKIDESMKNHKNQEKSLYHICDQVILKKQWQISNFQEKTNCQKL